MDVLLMVGVIAAIFAVVAVYVWFVDALTAYSLDKYSCDPAAGLGLLAMMAGWVLGLAALLFDTTDNRIAAFALATLILIGVGWHVARQTSVPVAIGSVVIMAVRSLLLLVTVVGVLGLLDRLFAPRDNRG